VTGALVIYLFQNNKIELDLSDKILKVRGLVVTDSLGVERVIIGSPLPPPQLHGYRFPRGENADVSGIMLYDSEGQERSGYVTDNDYGNVLFTLDSKSSQRVLFMAEPQGTSTLKMWGLNNNQIELVSSDEGTWMNATQNGKSHNLIKE
jgi:hypothetical protein